MHPRRTATRRSFLAAGAAGLLTACSGDSSQTATVRSSGSPPGAPATVVARLEMLERHVGARLGLYARDTGTGGVIAYRADERFAMCSTYKALAAAALLHTGGTAGLAKRIVYGSAQLVEGSPVTAAHAGTGLTLLQVCQAAVSDSDNTAGNLLLRELGGPQGVTRYARSLGDHVTRLDRGEPGLNEALPGDVRDTTSPRAIGADLEAVVLGTALAPASRELLTRWLVGDKVGVGRIRAAVPAGWTVADKTGTGRYGTGNDIAVLWPPGRSPIVVAIMSTQATAAAQPSNALIAQAARTVLPAP